MNKHPGEGGGACPSIFKIEITFSVKIYKPPQISTKTREPARAWAENSHKWDLTPTPSSTKKTRLTYTVSVLNVQFEWTIKDITVYLARKYHNFCSFICICLIPARYRVLEKIAQILVHCKATGKKGWKILMISIAGPAHSERHGTYIRW